MIWSRLGICILMGPYSSIPSISLISRLQYAALTCLWYDLSLKIAFFSKSFFYFWGQICRGVIECKKTTLLWSKTDWYGWQVFHILLDIFTSFLIHCLVTLSGGFSFNSLSLPLKNKFQGRGLHQIR